MFKKLILPVFAIVLCFSLIACNNTKKPATEKDTSEKQKEVYETNIELPDKEGFHYANIVIKDYGIITVELDANTAPITVENFINLANEGFYDGLTFHRIMSGFMIQGGDPNGNGSGGSGTKIKGEFNANGVENNISHVRGVISMARQGENPYTGEKNYDSATSQFFIVHEDSVFLDKQYAAFGKVLSGMEIVDEICKNVQPIDDNGTVPFAHQPVIETITIIK
jgi:peptidyl-prolyl cis-trans isomerase B (cyclophilin B)